jgi:hypothetical protein
VSAAWRRGERRQAAAAARSGGSLAAAALARTVRPGGGGGGLALAPGNDETPLRGAGFRGQRKGVTWLACPRYRRSGRGCPSREGITESAPRGHLKLPQENLPKTTHERYIAVAWFL